MPKNISGIKKHQFKKGQSGNPEGGRKHNPVLKMLRNVTLKEYREILEIILTGNLKDLQKIANDPNSSIIQISVASSIMKAIKTGNADVFEKFMSRIVGKIPDELTLNGNLNANVALLDPKLIKQAMTELEEDV